MKRTRSYFVVVALSAGLAATVALQSCATKPSAAPAASSPSAAAVPKPASTVAPASQSAAVVLPASPVQPAAPTLPAAKKAEPQPVVAAAADERPEVSFPRRSPLPVNVMVISMDEPRLPSLARPIPPLPTTPATAPQISAPKTAVPPEAPAASSPPAVAKAAPAPAKSRAPAKPADNPKPPATAKAVKKLPEPEPEPKNAASDEAIAVNPLAPAQNAISRTISAVEGTRFEVPFEGTGWTYLGEKSLKEGIAYDSRRFVSNSLVFVLNPIKAGDYFLRFQRQDSLRGLSYEDLIEVVVSPKPEPSTPSAVGVVGTVNGPVAPSAAPGVNVASSPSLEPQPVVSAPQQAKLPQAAIGGGATTTAANNGSVPAIPASSLTTPESALAQARSALAAGRAQGALDALDRLMTLAPTGTDEAFFLYGQALELNGPTKDIKRAYAYYEKIRDEYPESAFWDRANDRVSYIERHYFDIR